MSAVAAPARGGVALPRAGVRTGLRAWLTACSLALRWKLASLRLFIAVLFAVQLLSGVGFVLGFSLFFGRVPPLAALFLSTGVPVINLVMLGQIMVPQIVAEARVQNTYDFMRTMPIPASADAAAGFLLTLGIGIPPMVLSLLTAMWFYGITLTVSPLIVPAVLLTAFTGAMLGDALGYAVPVPMVTRVASQVLIFMMMGFSPVNFPAQQLPDWLARVNQGLPFAHMASVVRGALTTGLVGDAGTSYLVLGGWCVATGALALWARTRRE